MNYPVEIRRIAEKRARGKALTSSDKRTLAAFKTQRSSAPLLDVYPSMQALAAATGIPLASIKQAKRAGCPAFHASNRVNFRVLLQWIFTEGMLAQGEAKEEAERRERVARANLLEQELKQKAGELIDSDEVDRRIAERVRPLATYLRTQPDRLASRVNPADPAHARQVLIEEREAIFKLGRKEDMS